MADGAQTIVAFPPRDAGRVLDAALAAAVAAGNAETVRRSVELGRRRHFDNRPEIAIEQAALMAAVPILRSLTSDNRMVEIVALGMAAEVMSRLRKAGAV